jgi:hypothetical protein
MIEFEKDESTIRARGPCHCVSVSLPTLFLAICESSSDWQLFSLRILERYVEVSSEFTVRTVI